jgi:hypothetical protein
MFSYLTEHQKIKICFAHKTISIGWLNKICIIPHVKDVIFEVEGTRLYIDRTFRVIFPILLLELLEF